MTRAEFAKFIRALPGPAIWLYDDDSTIVKYTRECLINDRYITNEHIFEF